MLLFEDTIVSVIIDVCFWLEMKFQFWTQILEMNSLEGKFLCDEVLFIKQHCLYCQVWELTANGVVMVSAIGNDGPLYG